MLDEEWQCVSREASCVLGVRSLVMSYKFVLKCFYLLLIVFAHISSCFLHKPRWLMFSEALCVRPDYRVFSENFWLLHADVTWSQEQSPKLKTTAVFWRGPSMAIFLIEQGGAAVFCLKWQLQKFLNWIGLSGTHSSHKPGLNPSPELYLLII